MKNSELIKKFLNNNVDFNSIEKTGQEFESFIKLFI